MKIDNNTIKQDRDNLIAWYNAHKRTLPWRASRDPYKIWISEVMLQQTTVTAVVPYFTKFIKTFPTVKHLANASLEEVYEHWAGLGYYSRARNLHKAAQLFAAQKKFPQTAAELIEYPGLGPYTSRAIASLAFSEKVGVLDGNVIRVLSRKYGLKTKWWEPKEKQKLQEIADALAQTDLNSDLNQGLMELGATICTPKKVMCLMCPWKKSCISLKNDLIEEIPLKKPKDKFQIWHWHFDIISRDNKLFLTENTQTPFLKKMLLPPSQAIQLKTKPNNFAFKHNVTKYEIYITIQKHKKADKKNTGLWAKPTEIAKINPTSLMKKIITHLEKLD